jgi:23S rRNA (uridine2552-2'-O)-methyltransferase
MTAYNRKDHYYKKAKEDGFRSRAAFKLEQLQTKYKLIKTGDRVLDLGCSPGGFLQVAAKAAGEKGRVVGVDLLPLQPLHEYQHVYFILGDGRDPAVQSAIRDSIGSCADVVLSDMAPHTSGVKHADHARSVELARTAFTVALRFLKAGGSMLVKMFEGEELQSFQKEVEARFRRVDLHRPEATRKGSREIYIIARDFVRE